MYQLAAKGIWALLQPSNMTALLALGGLVLCLVRRDRSGPRLLLVSAFFMVVFGILPTGNYLLAPLENRFPNLAEKLPPHVDGIIVLGGGELPHMSTVRHQVTQNDFGDRLFAGAALARKYPKAILVYTGGGGQPNELNESDVARKYLTELGFAGPRFRFDSQAHNTWENAVETHKLMHPRPGQKWLLVTSAFHMPRAVGAFRRAGWHVIPYPAGYFTPGDPLAWNELSVSRNFFKTDLAVHEWLGLVVYRFLDRSSAFYPAP